MKSEKDEISKEQGFYKRYHKAVFTDQLEHV